MELIRRQIHVRNLIEGKYIRFKFPLMQSVDNMGLLSDYGKVTSPYTSREKALAIADNNQILVAQEFNASLNQSIDNSDTLSLRRVGDTIFAFTDSKLERVRSYDYDNPYIEGFNIRQETYTNYLGNIINGVDRITNIDPDSDEITYTFDAKADSNIGSTGQTTGLLYTDYPADGLDLPDDLDEQTTTTTVQYIGEGWNNTNVSSSRVIQEEYLLGIIQNPEIESDVFIDRGAVSVLDLHLRLSEVESLDHLTRYGNGLYNINKL